MSFLNHYEFLRYVNQPRPFNSKLTFVTTKDAKKEYRLRPHYYELPLSTQIREMQELDNFCRELYFTASWQNQDIIVSFQDTGLETFLSQEREDVLLVWDGCRNFNHLPKTFDFAPELARANDLTRPKSSIGGYNLIDLHFKSRQDKDPSDPVIKLEGLGRASFFFPYHHLRRYYYEDYSKYGYESLEAFKAHLIASLEKLPKWGYSHRKLPKDLIF